MRYTKTENSAKHDFAYVFRKNIWTFALLIIVLMILIPFSTAGLNGSSIFNISVTHMQLKFRLFHDNAVIPIMAVLIVMGFIIGFSLFRFLLDKKETTIFLSLGMTRRRLFANRFLFGCIASAVGVGVPMLVSCLLNISALGGYQCLVRNTIYLSIGMFVCSVFSMLVAACAVFIAGTVSQALVYWAGLMCLPQFVLYAFNALIKELFFGNAYGVVSYSGTEEIRASLYQQFASLNPLFFLKSALETNGKFYRPLTTDVPDAIDVGLVVGWAIAVVVLCIVAMLLLKARKAENAGVRCKNRVASEAVIFTIAFMAFALVYTMLAQFGGVLAAVFGVAAILVVHLFFRKTFFQSNGKKEPALSFIIHTAAMVAVCFICVFALQANVTNVLDNSVIAEAKISYCGDPSSLYEDISGSTTGKGYYVKSQITLNSVEGVNGAKALQKLFIESGKQSIGDKDELEDTVVPYDITFEYTDTSGKNYIWYYDRASYSQLEQFISLEGIDEIRESMQDNFSVTQKNTDSRAASAFSSKDIYITDPLLCDTYSLDITDDAREELMEALGADYAELTTDQRYFSDADDVAVLMFTDKGDQDTEYFTYHLDNAYIYVTEDYTNTIKWLEDNDLLSLVEDEPEAEYVILQEFDPFVGINGLQSPMGMYFMAYCADSEDDFVIQKDFGQAYKVSDADEVSEIIANSKDAYYMTKGSYLVAVKLQGEDKLRYMFLPSDKIPSFLERK